MKEKCNYCFSENTCFVQIRKNLSGNKRIHKCFSCKRRFTPNDGFRKFRHSPIVIKSALNMAEKGLSLSKISYYLNKNFRVFVTRKTIFDWKIKFLNKDHF